MRREVSDWLGQAEHDFDAAKKILHMKEYYLVAFLCQQAAEKGLKALILLKLRDMPRTHNLVELGRVAKIPDKYFTALSRLTPQYIFTRYPDVAQGVPAEMYNEDRAKSLIKDAGLVLRWVKEKIL